MLEWLLQAREMLLELRQSAEAMRCRSTVKLAGALEMRVEPVFCGGLRRKRDRGPVHPDLLQVMPVPAGIVLAGEFMRQVDHEAGVAAGGTPSDALRLEDDDAVVGDELGETPGRRKTGESR